MPRREYDSIVDDAMWLDRAVDSALLEEPHQLAMAEIRKSRSYGQGLG